MFLVSQVMVAVPVRSSPASTVENGTVLAVDPAISTRNPGELFKIRVNVTNVVDLYCWAFTLRWERGLLECVYVKEETAFFDGDFHSAPPESDHVDVTSTLMGSVPGVNGGGKLVTFTFGVKDTGNSTLELRDSVMYNSGTTTPPTISHTVMNGTFYTTSPKAKFTYSPDPTKGPEYYARPIVGETVTFNATSSYDPDDYYGDPTPEGIVSYEWDFGDETTGTGKVTTHMYDEAGKYEVKLTVTDDEGETDTEIYPLEWLKIFLHDIAVINVTVVNKPPEVYVGGTVKINATVLNQGSDTEYINVTVYFNDSPLNTTLFHYREYHPPPSPPTDYYSLESGKNATTTIIVDTTGLTEGEYTVTVEAFLVHQLTAPPYPYVSLPGVEPDQTDNEFEDGTVQVGILGDINGDGKVDYWDAFLFRKVYIGEYDPSADFDEDGDVDYWDAFLFRGYYIAAP